MSNARSNSNSNKSFAQRSELLLIIGMLAVILVLIVPLPTFVLDMMLALNLGMSVMLLLITVSAKQPLQLSVFPSLLLLLTLYRLAVNVATTRLILSEGDAGNIVSTFGGLIVGNSMVVGIVIFLILITIQFIVITKGATRISEVNARFVLDALPGKQMAIDAELSAKVIGREEAQARREVLTREAEFYGAMDGASKYVRGDAIAGLIITGVNIVGGIIIGMMQGLSISEAGALYSMLTIGDGLVSQIPALIIATTAGVLVTKASTDESLGQEVGAQLFQRRRPLVIGAVILVVIGLIPGLPKIPFFLLAGTCYYFSRSIPGEKTEEEPTVGDPTESDAEPVRPEEEAMNEFVQAERVLVEVGIGLAELVQPDNGMGLEERISNLRKELARNHGFWVPAVRIRSNMKLGPNQYEVHINRRFAGKSELRPNEFLAIDPGTSTLEIDGDPTREPAFGLEAKWISRNTKQRAEIGGFTIVDAPTVLITHLGELLRKHAHELLGAEEVHQLLQKVEETSPNVIKDLKPDVIKTGTLRRVLCHLIAERVSIASLDIILESVAHYGQTIKDPEQLCDYVRTDLGSQICERFLNSDRELQLIMLDPKLEGKFREHLHEGNLALPAAPLEKLFRRLQTEWERQAVKEQDVAVLTDFQTRRPLRKAIFRALPDLAVVGFTELPKDLPISAVAYLKIEDIFDPVTNGVVPVGDAMTANPLPGDPGSGQATPTVRAA